MRRSPRDRSHALTVVKTAIQALMHPWQGFKASTLSDAIDRHFSTTDIARDPALTALLDPGGAKPMPPGQVERTWARLEHELFSTSPVTGDFSIPYPARRGPALSLGRRLLPVAAMGALLAAAAAWHAPYYTGKTTARSAVVRWSSVRSFDADVQMVSQVPGYQMQWSGEERFERPDRAWLQSELLGLPLTIIARGRVGVIDSPLGGINARGVGRLRFLTRMLRADQVIDMLDHARWVRCEGTDRVLGEECRILSFPAHVSRDDATWTGNALARYLPRGVTVVHLWVSSSTSLPVQVEALEAGGAPAVSYRYTRFQENPSLPSQLFSIPSVMRSRPGVTLRHADIRLRLGND